MTAPTGLGVKLGQIIDQELTERGWPQTKLSELSGVPNTTITRIVKGQVDEVRASIVAQIAKGLGEPFWHLMQRIGYVPDGLDPDDEAKRLATVFAADPGLIAVLRDVEGLEERDRDVVLSVIADLRSRRQKRRKPPRRRRKADPQPAEESG